MIDFNVPADAKVLELGGGANRHPKSTCNVDIRQVQGVDFTVDFNKEEWPEIGDNEFDIVVSIYALEHVSWRMVPSFLKNTLCKLKPGGRAIFVIPNTQAQMKLILAKPEFDGDEGSMLFGTLDYPENSHRAAFSPGSATKLFTEAGFTNILITPFGALQTDMVVEATKPGTPHVSEPALVPNSAQPPLPQPQSASAPQVSQPTRPASERFNLSYFEKYCGSSFYWDYPNNYTIAQKILERQPKNVIELGAARGYVLKRIQDAGIPGKGVDVSQHAWMTRVCDPIKTHDLIQALWPLDAKECDLAYSLNLLEYIPEAALPSFMGELKRISTRGLHGVALEGGVAGNDPERCTIHNLEYWKRIMPEGHEVVDIRELGSGNLPENYIRGDGTIRINAGCAWTMAYGYLNIDTIDAENFARLYKHQYLRHDLRNGIPLATGVVDAIFAHHFCEHLSYEELARFLKECRRVIRPDGCMRIVVPDAEILTYDYHNLPGLSRYDDMNVGTAKASTSAEKLWSLLGQGHASFLDEETLFMMLDDNGWVPHKASFRQTEVPAVKRILAETIELTYGDTSLFVDATPKLGGST